MKNFFTRLDTQDYFISIGLIMVFAGFAMVSLDLALIITGTMVLILGILPFFLMRKTANGLDHKDVQN